MLDRYRININNGVKEPTRGFQIYNISQTLMSVYVKVRGSLYTRVVIWIKTTFDQIDTRMILHTQFRVHCSQTLIPKLFQRELSWLIIRMSINITILEEIRGLHFALVKHLPSDCSCWLRNVVGVQHQHDDSEIHGNIQICWSPPYCWWLCDCVCYSQANQSVQLFLSCTMASNMDLMYMCHHWSLSLVISLDVVSPPLHIAFLLLLLRHSIESLIWHMVVWTL